jgi:hypothetical protein
MNFVLQPWQLLISILDGCNSQQQRESGHDIRIEKLILQKDVRSRSRSTSGTGLARPAAR